MNIMPQTLNKLRAKLDRDLVAAPFSSLPEYKSITYHQGLGKMLGIENPFFRSTEGPQGRHTLIDGKPVLNFAWCDYLGLSKHPDLIEASKAAIDAYGTSVSASRMVSGDTPLHRELEQEIADTIGVEGALVFVSGHAANVSTIGTIMTADDLIIHDEFVHNSAVVGMRLSGAKTHDLQAQQARRFWSRCCARSAPSTRTASSSSKASIRPRATSPISPASSS